nr:MAG TPA: hypothetical protein [Caudoviricetes sp.]
MARPACSLTRAFRSNASRSGAAFGRAALMAVL